MHHARLNCPWPPAGQLLALGNSDGTVLVPAHMPVCTGHFIKKERTRGDGRAARERENTRIGGDCLYLGESEDIALGIDTLAALRPTSRTTITRAAQSRPEPLHHGQSEYLRNKFIAVVLKHPCEYTLTTGERRYNAAVLENLRGTALIGCGGMASHYRAVYAHYPHAPFRLVVDANAEVAQSVAQELGVARWSTDWREALAEDLEIDVVDISTPNHLHEEQAVALLNAGKHVIIQKPLAPSVAACQRIVEAAQQSGTQAGVYLSDLEDPAVWDLRTMVRKGYFGRITGIRARYAHRGGLTSAPSAWRGSVEKTGGGSFIQLAIHHTNLASWLLDEEIVSVMGSAKNLMCENIGGDDTAACVAEFSGGATGVFESAWNAEGTCFQLYGSEGSVTIHGTEGARIEGNARPYYEGHVLHTNIHGNFGREAIGAGAVRGKGGQFDQHVAFLEAVRRGNMPEVPVAVGRTDVTVCKAVIRSAETGRRVTIREILEEAL